MSEGVTEKIYLGDGVYAAFNGYQVILTAENGTLVPLHTIYLEPDVLDALNRYVERLKKDGVRK